jgi:hypothetical protein
MRCWTGSVTDRTGVEYRQPMTARIGWLRVLVGLVLGAAPRVLLQASTGEQPSGSMLLLARTVGIRDVVIGGGTLSAARSGSSRDMRRWVAVGLTSDILDAVVGGASARLIGKRGAVISTGVTLPVIAAGIRALAQLESAPPGGVPSGASPR